MTSLVDELSTWLPTWQVWILLVGIVRSFFGMVLEGRPNGICRGNFGFTLRACSLQKTMGYSLWTSMVSSDKHGTMVIPWPNVFGVNMP